MKIDIGTDFAPPARRATEAERDDTVAGAPAVSYARAVAQPVAAVPQQPLRSSAAPTPAPVAPALVEHRPNDERPHYFDDDDDDGDGARVRRRVRHARKRGPVHRLLKDG